MFKISDLLFNINNLLSPSLQAQLEQMEKLEDKIYFLFKVIDFSHNFSDEITSEVNEFYLAHTGERYDDVYLSEDDRELIIEYSEYCSDFEKIKQGLNGICCSDSYDECVAAILQEIDNVKQQQVQQDAEKSSQSLTTQLIFDDDEKTNSSQSNGKAKSFDEMLKRARAIAEEHNKKK